MEHEQDVGTKAVQFVFELMRIDAEWSIREPRGFTWWGKDHAQWVSATALTEDRGVLVSRLMAVTDIVKGVPANLKTFSCLGTAHWLNGTLSGLVYDWSAGIVRYVTSATIHEQNQGWIQQVFAHSVAMQAAEAQAMGLYLAGQIGGQPATSAHPVSGPRPNPDDMLNWVSVLPMAQQPSSWVGEEMESARETLTQISLACFGDRKAVSAEFPYLTLTSLLEVDAAYRHPLVGNGLLMTLRLPDNADRETLDRAAAVMNVLELETYPFGHFRGGWCVNANNDLTFQVFYPNVMCLPGLAINLVLQMAGRAEWVATLNDKRSREERWKTACPAFLRVLEARD